MIQTRYRRVEQLVARRAHNPEVAGSSPAPATTKRTVKRQVLPFFSFAFGQNLKFGEFCPQNDPKTGKLSTIRLPLVEKEWRDGKNNSPDQMARAVSVWIRLFSVGSAHCFPER